MGKIEIKEEKNGTRSLKDTRILYALQKGEETKRKEQEKHQRRKNGKLERTDG